MALTLIVLVIIFEWTKEGSLMMYNSVGLVCDVFLIDLIKIILYKNCLPDKNLTKIEENHQVDD